MDLHSSTTKCLLNSVLRVDSQRQKISRAKRNSRFKRRSRCPLDDWIRWTVQIRGTIFGSENQFANPETDQTCYQIFSKCVLNSNKVVILGVKFLHLWIGMLLGISWSIC